MSNATPAAHRVAVFIFVPGAGWYTKPTCAQPLTPIQANGSWTADITTGGSDPLATRIAALLVSTNYNQPCVLDAVSLPTNVTAQALASVIADRDDPSIRRLDFSGYNWWVKNSASPVGPGPNYFSASTNNVWLDASNRLHLRITNRSNAWQCAELVTRRTFGHGSYRFTLDSRVDNLDPNVVLGLFTWSDDPAYAYREIDLEFSRWGNASDPSNAQYVVQPFDAAGHLVRFTVPTTATNSTHLFTWETNRVSFQSMKGGFTNSPPPGNAISNWVYSLAVPPSGDENIRINLWLSLGRAPTDSKEVEVVIKSFQFVPLGVPHAAWLTNFARLPNGHPQFHVVGELDRRYDVQASDNLVNWQTLATVLATNLDFRFEDLTPGSGSQRYYRSETLP